MLKWIPLANPGWLEKLLIISWNCWVKIKNEMETLKTFYVLPLLVLYLRLLQSQIMHALKHYILWPIWIATFCRGVTTRCRGVTTAYTFQPEVWTEKSGKTLHCHLLLKANFHLKTCVSSLIYAEMCILFALLRNQTRLI